MGEKKKKKESLNFSGSLLSHCLFPFVKLSRLKPHTPHLLFFLFFFFFPAKPSFD